MNNLAVTLKDQGDLPGARDFQGQVLDASRRLLGSEHPDTTLSSWNLFSTLLDLQEMDAAVDVFNKDLTWLLQAEPNRLVAVQTKIRQNLMEMLNQKS